MLSVRPELNASPHAYEERETNQEPKKTGKHKDFPRLKLSHHPRSLVDTLTASPFISEIPFHDSCFPDSEPTGVFDDPAHRECADRVVPRDRNETQPITHHDVFASQIPTKLK